MNLQFINSDYFSPAQFTDKQFDRYQTAEGYITPDGVYHAYIPDYQGNIVGVVNTAERAWEQYTEYYPYGLPFADSSNPTANRRKYGAKELTPDLGLNAYDFEARTLSPAFPMFSQPDLLAEKYYCISSYCYAKNNPINFIDFDGLYPKSIVTYHKSHGISPSYYKLTKPAVCLLSLISSVPQAYIEGVEIWERGPGHYLPLYNCYIEPGAITLGSNPYSSLIIMTENYFEDEPAKYNNKGYGQNVKAWLYILSHEVRHLNHIGEFANGLKFAVSFMYDYIRYPTHDDVPREKDANEGSKEFKKFNDFVNEKYNSTTAIMDLFNSDRTDSEKISIIIRWWQDYSSYKKKNESNESIFFP